MKPLKQLFAFCLLMAFLFSAGNVNAEMKTSFVDSICCTPDSLKLVSASFPVFCVRWKVRPDSNCKKIAAFEVQWKLLSASSWVTRTVTYTSPDTVVNFCDSVYVCGLYQWRVRTKCKDSSYSSWVSGLKFGFSCGEGGESAVVRNISISPNPASENITINMNGIKPGAIKIAVVSLTGRNVLDKTVYTKSALLTERISVSGFRKGMYFISIMSNGIVAGRGTFVKE